MKPKHLWPKKKSGDNPQTHFSATITFATHLQKEKAMSQGYVLCSKKGSQ